MRLLLALLLLTTPLRAEPITVFAAASLAGPLDIIAARFTQETGTPVTLSYGASSTVARQISAGAPADVVILANQAWMDTLEANGSIDPDTITDVLRNSLALIGPADAPDTPFETLAQSIGESRLALALTEAVPAGIYARQALTASAQWDALRPQIVETDNVRAALQLVAIGAVRYGITYTSDARTNPRVRVLSHINGALHGPILYPVALTPDAPMEAEAFLDTLFTLPAAGTFVDAGFVPHVR